MNEQLQSSPQPGDEDKRAAALAWLHSRPNRGNNARHSTNPEIYTAARQDFLRSIAEAARRDRERNPAWQQLQRVKQALAA